MKKFLMQIRFMLPSVSDLVVEMWGKSLFESYAKYPESINCFSMHANLVSQPWKFW